MLTVGVDIGGTFTDVVGVKDGRELYSAKIPSTYAESLVTGVAEGLERILHLTGEAGGDVARFIHGTTVATNALLEETGASLGLLTTRGFEDVLEIGRALRPREELYGLAPPPQTPGFLVPRRRRIGIRERVDATGRAIQALAEEEVIAAARWLVEEERVDALSVCYLFSFSNPAHELRTRDLIHELYPDLEISLSCEVDPAVREYERLCVTCTDAYLRPVVRRYLREIDAGLRDMGVPARLQIMQSRGGIAAAANAMRRPVSLVASGPAAGVLGGIDAAAQCGAHNVITIDIGGTSSDVALVKDGQPMVSRSGIVRGFPLRLASVDVNSIGAGGGSIAWLDTAGGLHVGPRSAGSRPGPACYGRGGIEPTVTDASVALGYLDPTYFAGGTFELQADLAEEAIDRLGEQLGLSRVETALGIHRVVNANMADQIRLLSVGRGYDPRDFALVVLGGAGAVHGAAVAEELAIPQVIVPKAPGVLSAYGLLVSSIEHEAVITYSSRTDQTDAPAIEERLAVLERQTMEAMAEENVDDAAVVVLRSADMRYVGQSFELEVPLAGSGADDLVERAREAFYDAHERVYRHASRSSPVEFVNLRVTLVHRLSHPQPESSKERLGDLVPSRTRTLYFPDEQGGVDSPVYRRDGLRVAATFTGPAIVDQDDTTLVVPPDWQVAVQPTGELLLTRRR